MNYKFYYPDWNNRKSICKKYPQIEQISKQPIAFWYGVGPKRRIKKTKNSIERLLRRTSDCFPILVVYSIPQRDLGNHSKGGAKDDIEYIDFIKSFSEALGDKSPIVIYEPDAIPHLEDMGTFDGLKRIKLIKQSIDILSKTNALIYMDIGNPEWLSVPKAVSYLRMCDIKKINGFSLNVSNYFSTDICFEYGKRISDRLDGTHFVIDTSRNGSGHNGEYFNPYGRSIGEYPTTYTCNELIDAYLWIKVPGESDGKVNNGPKAGRFSHTLALDLLNN